MPNNVPKLMIQLPCKANELAEKIRCFCEHNGSFDTAVVKYELVKSVYCFDPGVRLVITIPEETKQ